MTKYMIFDWGEGMPLLEDETPATRLLGTFDELPKDEPPGHPVQYENLDGTKEWGTSLSGFKTVDQEVTLADNLMLGKTYPMKVYVKYGRDEPERKIVAYYEVPNSG